MNTLWIWAILAGVGTISVLVLTWRLRRGDQDLGEVSHRWITEHRMGHVNDSRP